MTPDKSCASLPANETLRPGSDSCNLEDCKGDSDVDFQSSTESSGEYGKWSDWSICTAPDCKNNPNHAVMTRTQTNVDDPTDVKTQEIPCQSPCPPGETMMKTYDNE